MEIYEQMVKFKYKKLIIRCWIPSNDYQYFNHGHMKNLYLTKLKEILSVLAWRGWRHIEKFDFIYIAKQLAKEFGVNACEVTSKKTGCGAVYYRDWP